MGLTATEMYGARLLQTLRLSLPCKEYSKIQHLSWMRIPQSCWYSKAFLYEKQSGGANRSRQTAFSLSQHDHHSH